MNHFFYSVGRFDIGFRVPPCPGLLLPKIPHITNVTFYKIFFISYYSFCWVITEEKKLPISHLFFDWNSVTKLHFAILHSEETSFTQTVETEPYTHTTKGGQ